MIQEILILWAVFLMTVNEAFYEPDFFLKTYKKIILLYIQTTVTNMHTVTEYQSSTCVLNQQPVDAS